MPVVNKEKKAPTKKTSQSGATPSMFKPVQVDEFIKIMLYGRAGTGKTTFWSTFPGKIGCCLASSRNGELKSLPKDVRKRVEVANINSAQDLHNVVTYQEETGAFDLIVLDHITAYQDVVLARILGLDKVIEQKSWGLATQNQYGQCILQCKESIGRLLDLKCSVAIIAQERDFGSPDLDNLTTVLPSVGASVSPSLAVWLNYSVDYVTRTYIRKEKKKVRTQQGKLDMEEEVETGKVEYCLYTYPDDVFTTKFRVPKGVNNPGVITDPTWEKVLKLIQG